MSETIETPLRGTIKVNAQFRPTFGVVELSEPYHGRKYAVINGDTAGRVALLNLSKDGCLPVGQEVVINKAAVFSQALMALEVEAFKQT